MILQNLDVDCVLGSGVSHCKRNSKLTHKPQLDFFWQNNQEILSAIHDVLSAFVTDSVPRKLG